MNTRDYYTIPADSLDWQVGQDFTTTFRWEYRDGRAELLDVFL